MPDLNLIFLILSRLLLILLLLLLFEKAAAHIAVFIIRKHSPQKSELSVVHVWCGRECLLVVGRGSWVVGPKSWVVGRGFQVVGRGLFIGRDLH